MVAKSPLTIADIARLAGVSKSTVSRALNDSPLIGNETKERVRAIAVQQRFQVNVPARRLSLKQSHTIGFVTYAYTKNSRVPDVFMLEIMSGISVALHAHGYDLLVVHVDSQDNEWAREYLETGRVDGFILLSATCTESHLETLADVRAPFVIWGPPAPDHSYSSVSGDNVAGGKIATEHLLGIGRRRVAFLGGWVGAVEVKDRLRGYEVALQEAGHAVDPALVAYGDFSEASGGVAMRQLLQRAPDLDAVFVNSDLMAISAMDAIREDGRSVPDDIAVIGYDDVSIAQYSNPPLTTIRQDGPLSGKLLAQTLIQRLQTGVVTNVSIPAELVVRTSA